MFRVANPRTELSRARAPTGGRATPSAERRRRRGPHAARWQKEKASCRSFHISIFVAFITTFDLLDSSVLSFIVLFGCSCTSDFRDQYGSYRTICRFSYLNQSSSVYRDRDPCAARRRLISASLPTLPIHEYSVLSSQCTPTIRLVGTVLCRLPTSKQKKHTISRNAQRQAARTGPRCPCVPPSVWLVALPLIGACVAVSCVCAVT